MRNAIAGSWVYTMVLIFTVILVGYVAVSINYAHAYQINQKITTTVETSSGYNQDTKEKIYDIFDSYSYQSTGTCSNETINGHTYDYIGSKDRDTPDIKNGAGRYKYCIVRTDATKGGNTVYYYKITNFFGFTIPVFGEIFTFRVSDETNPILYPVTNDFFVTLH